ncbi:MAG: DNA methylase [Clostridia bacterium]|nr:DNA methylase [Clostridia bacterium]
MLKSRIYLCIDLKSFYSSVECVERGLDPLKTNLVVADNSRTEKTICLAASPAIKSYGIKGRSRLFEVVQRIKEVNADRIRKVGKFEGESYSDDELKSNPKLEVSYIVATPRMSLYMKYSTSIYEIYLKYIAPEDILVYSVDEVFMDITDYLKGYKMTPREFAMTVILDVLKTTGITATAGIGTNMYLAKVAMDIDAKHIEPDENGVRISTLDEMSYRKRLWEHTPITDFWRVGKGYAAKLEKMCLFTMGDIARCSLSKAGEDNLYRVFGINAELLIDHAWGYEPCTMADVRAYRPKNNCLSSGQVLQCPYDFQKARLIVQEMADLLALDLVRKELVTDQIVLTIGYDIENLTNKDIKNKYKGEVTKDFYGRSVPKHAHGTGNIGKFTASSKLITNAALSVYDKEVNPDLLIRRVNITANHIIPETAVEDKILYEQLDLFTQYEQVLKEREKEAEKLSKEKRIQKAMIEIKEQFGKNAIIKGMNLKDGATTIERNKMVGGHKE